MTEITRQNESEPSTPAALSDLVNSPDMHPTTPEHMARVNEHSSHAPHHLHHAISEVHAVRAAAANPNSHQPDFWHRLTSNTTSDSSLPNITFVHVPLGSTTFREACQAGHHCTDETRGDQLFHNEYGANGKPIFKDVVSIADVRRTVYDGAGSVSSVARMNTINGELQGIVHYNHQGVAVSEDSFNRYQTHHSERDANGRIVLEVNTPRDGSPATVEHVGNLPNGDYYASFGSIVNGREHPHRMEIGHTDGTSATVWYDLQTGKPNRVVEGDGDLRETGHFNIDKDGMHRDYVADIVHSVPLLETIVSHFNPDY